MRVCPKVKGRSAAAAAELAMVLPLFLLLIFGFMEASRFGMVAQVLTGAAREGCRVAVLPGKTQSDVQSRVNSYLSGTAIPSLTPTITPGNWATATSGTPVTVTVTVPYRQVSLFGQLFQSTTIAASATFSSERP
ncbi:MAG: TadE/TadG family type IV pilus assembly protein [Gemmataceae bacterium]